MIFAVTENERTVQRMAELIVCPVCGAYFDKELVEDGFAICPYCEKEVEVNVCD